MDTKDNARNELSYISTSEPASVSASRLPTSYTRIGAVISDTLAGSRNMIPADDKDSGEGTTVIPGRSSGSIQIQGNRAKDGNAGQIIVRDAWRNGTRVYWLKSDNVIGDVAVYGEGYVENYEEGSEDESVRSYTATINVQGLPNWFVIQT